MVKKLAIVLVVGCFLTTAFSSNVLAAENQLDARSQELLGKLMDDIAQIQQVDPQCAIPLLLGLFRGIRAINAGAAEPGACAGINISNALADMLSDWADYNICILGESPDEEALAQWETTKIIAEAIDCNTNLLDVAYCTPDPSALAIFGMISNCRSIVPEEEPAE